MVLHKGFNFFMAMTISVEMLSCENISLPYQTMKSVNQVLDF